MNLNSEDVDFDFFDTPRNSTRESPKSKGNFFDAKPPASSSAHTSKHGDLSNGKGKQETRYSDERENKTSNSRSNRRRKYSDDSSSTDSESETPRYEKQKPRAPAKSSSSVNDKKSRIDDYSLSESSSAYSNSDYSSEEEFAPKPTKVKKEIVDVRLPNAQEAWGNDGGQDNNRHDDVKNSRHSDKEKRTKRSKHDRKSHSESSGSESDNKDYRRERSSFNRNDRPKSAKTRDRRNSDERKRRPFKSNGSSFSNNSDITDVSPLESPENSPRQARKSGKENGKVDDVQYKDLSSPDREADIKLETEEIDLSILMKCMADIDREKQERLKTNSRRVMFAPPAANEKRKGNYTFSVGRAKVIEKENQRLLKQIMNQVHSGPSKRLDEREPKGPRKPKKATVPVIQRLTPSAVNRMREQRRIESENMHILNRLSTVRPTNGMSKHEQISEFERQMSYGIPTGTVIIPGEVVPHGRSSRAHSSMSTMSVPSQRSRPSSAKSNSSAVPGRRSRPSSAKSNASVMSNASMRSNVSKRSTMSIRSNMSMGSGRRRSDERADNRPVWDDRFSFS